MTTVEVSKVAIIKLDNDYGGLKAWTIQESYDGVIHDLYSHKTLKREYFDMLQHLVVDYLSQGFKVEIENK